jgi:hypothetical protein
VVLHRSRGAKVLRQGFKGRHLHVRQQLQTLV